MLASRPDPTAPWALNSYFAGIDRVLHTNNYTYQIMAGLQGKSFSTGVFPTVNYANTRFGGTGVHVLKVDCGKSQYVTESQNKSAF